MTRSEQLDYDIHVLESLVTDLSGYSQDELALSAIRILRAGLALRNLANRVVAEEAA